MIGEKKSYDIVIIGGGPAGLAAAVSAKKNGIDSVLVIERDSILGGILNQCIHNGFGLHTFKEELTGPEYAARFIRMAEEANVEIMLDTMVMDIDSDRHVTAMNRTDGLFTIDAKAVILAMGCRERPRGALNIPGYRRPVFTRRAWPRGLSIWKGIFRERKPSFSAPGISD
jgi:NADPH-dependent 2,4-dienoyl-CoA reductase/sulfur reductase-like enzyme